MELSSAGVSEFHTPSWNSVLQRLLSPWSPGWDGWCEPKDPNFCSRVLGPNIGRSLCWTMSCLQIKCEGSSLSRWSHLPPAPNPAFPDLSYSGLSGFKEKDRDEVKVSLPWDGITGHEHSPEYWVGGVGREEGTEMLWLMFTSHVLAHSLVTCGMWITLMGFRLGGASGKEPTCQCRRYGRHRFDPWVGKILWRRAWQPTPVFLPGESHGQRSLMGYSP